MAINIDNTGTQRYFVHVFDAIVIIKKKKKINQNTTKKRNSMDLLLIGNKWKTVRLFTNDRIEFSCKQSCFTCNFRFKCLRIHKGLTPSTTTTTVKKRRRKIVYYIKLKKNAIRRRNNSALSETIWTVYRFDSFVLFVSSNCACVCVFVTFCTQK